MGWFSKKHEVHVENLELYGKIKELEGLLVAKEALLNVERERTKFFENRGDRYMNCLKEREEFTKKMSSELFEILKQPDILVKYKAKKTETK